jgi:hypothetical protein
MSKQLARHSEYKIHLVVFAPTHQLVAAEAGVAAQKDVRIPPRRSSLRDSFDFRQTTERGIVVGSRKHAHKACSPQKIYGGK